MEGLVYILSAVTAVAVAWLLLRQYRRNQGLRLLLWSGICFGFLALSNLLLYADEVLIPDVELGWTHRCATLIGVFTLVAGLVLDAEER